MTYGPYPVYKEVPLEWAPSIPNEWAAKRLSWVYREIGSGTTPSNEELLSEGGDHWWVTTGELRESVVLKTLKRVTDETLQNYSALQLFTPGTLLIAMYGATIGRLGTLGVPACTNQACCALGGSILASRRFGYYALLAARQHLLVLASGGGQPNINQGKLRSLRIPVPSDSEQHDIVDFLDRETAQIDELIGKQNALIELLGERRKAVIAKAVTTGFETNAPLKDSGTRWLGKVPRHWGVVSADHISMIFVPDRDKPNLFSDGDPPWVTTELVGDQALRPSDLFVRGEDSGYRAVPPGSVIASCVGRLGVSSVTTYKCVINQQLQAYVPSKVVDKFFLWYCVQSSADYFQSVSTSATLPYVNRQNFGDLKVPLPPLSEQVNIINWLNEHCAKIDALIDKAAQFVDLLRERRSALITTAVTGKIDVRNLEIRELPDKVEA